MNDSTRNFARQQIRDSLSLLPEYFQETFKRWHSPEDLTKSISDVVAGIPEKELDLAFGQVEYSIRSLVSGAQMYLKF